MAVGVDTGGTFTDVVGDDGGVLKVPSTPRDPSRELPTVPAGAEALAVCLLHSDLDESQERELTERLAPLGLPVWRSSDVSPEFREYERTVTTVVSAHLGPTCRDYLARLATMADS